MIARKKLIEVALPLEMISEAAAHEKDIHVGQPANLHAWWSRKPLAACRAVLFAQLVDDPSSYPSKFPDETAQELERKRLFSIIENLVKWENSNNEQVLAAAREEILKSCDGDPPPVADPFCGGGSIPLEAQRLGLKAYASDLNPVAVIITKALTEIPRKFANKAPVNPEARTRLIEGVWKGAQGMADDVRHYGQWMHKEAERRIGRLYPKTKIAGEWLKRRQDLKGLANKELTVIAWLWARTIKCPNPACGARTPMVSKFWLSTHKGNEAWVRPTINHHHRTFSLEVAVDGERPPDGTKGSRKSRCLFCSTDNISDQALREQATNEGITNVPLAVVLEGPKKRIYIDAPPIAVDESNEFDSSEPLWLDQTLPGDTRWFSPPGYGLKTYRSLFTPKQLQALFTMSDLVADAYDRVLSDSGGDSEYATAIATYLGLAVDRLAQTNNTLVRWLVRKSGTSKGTPAFDRQAIPMVWEFAEANLFGDSVGSWSAALKNLLSTFKILPLQAGEAFAHQLDASGPLSGVPDAVFSTDPPYYDNMGYSDLSEFFYGWLRRSLRKYYPDIFSTLATPKEQEVVASAHRYGSKDAAKAAFEHSLAKCFNSISQLQNPSFPLTVYYAFKQEESDNEPGDNRNGPPGQAVSTGWETMLEGLLRARFTVNATWPMRTEGAARMNAIETNALASSIVLACRLRPDDAPLATRKEFVQSLREELPSALRRLQHGNIAPVDLAQAAIGPGMAIFSRYSKVLETDGSQMRVRAALGLINQALDEVLAEQETEYDAETRWALAWFAQYGMNEGKHGDAENLARAKDTAPNALEDAGIIWRKAGKAQLISREKLSTDWDPRSRGRVTVWEVTQHLIRALEADGEVAAATIIRRLPAVCEAAKDLAYRLFTICDRKGWSQAALPYNMLVASWPELHRLAAGTVGVTAELPSSAT